MSKIRKGFTLIEVAVVLVVLAILAAIAIPTFAAFMDGVSTRAAQAEADAFERHVNAVDALDGIADGLTQAELTALAADSGADGYVSGGTVTFNADRDGGTDAVVTVTVKP